MLQSILSQTVKKTKSLKKTPKIAKVSRSSLPIISQKSHSTNGVNDLKREQERSFLEYYGSLSFNEKVQSKLLPKKTRNELKDCIRQGKPVPVNVADTVAAALQSWALNLGASHFTHWFQPLTGLTAEKHDSFIKPNPDGGASTAFSGKKLMMGEPDASSFPSGGLRTTHEARGYTIWDPQTPPFIMEEGGPRTLVIPTAFVSWKGHALDRKLPLLRSAVALEKEALKLLEAMGEKGHHEVFTDSGVEQEFFLIDREHFEKRPDLKVTGRTLIGSRAAKDQELSDSYFGPLPTAALKCISAIETALWKIGIPVTTRHREVAPNQFELAPIFQRSSIASDQNMMMMEMMQRVAAKHGMAALLHEKPFAGVNGSGKHNNWSIGTNKIPTVFNPGNKPEENNIFLIFLAATVRAVDVHGIVLRHAISGAGNDHRLGANEAPPAIMSVYLGDDLHDLVYSIIENRPMKNIDTDLDLGVGYLPKVQRDRTDRNRTSPFAFTGQKFEVRACGSSQRPSASNIALNAMLADSCKYLASEIEKKTSGGLDAQTAVKEVVKETLTKHKRVVYNGDNYSAAWVEEAEKRGLQNLRTTPEVLEKIWNEKTVDLFSGLNIMSREEFRAQLNVDIEFYSKTIHLEGREMKSLADRHVVPSAMRYAERLMKAGEKQRSQEILKLVEESVSTSGELEQVLSQLESKIENSNPDDISVATYARDNVKSLMDKFRVPLDRLEELVDSKVWDLPTYEEILFEQN